MDIFRPESIGRARKYHPGRKMTLTLTLDAVNHLQLRRTMNRSLCYLALLCLVCRPCPLFATENLSHITQNGGTILFAEDFEDDVMTEDDWPDSPGYLSWAGGPVAGRVGDGCETGTGRRNNYIDTAPIAAGAVPGSTRSLKTPYPGACPEYNYTREGTEIKLPAPVREYFIRWYQKWSGSFKKTKQHKFTKFYNAAKSVGSLTAHFSFEGPDTRNLANFMYNYDGQLNKDGLSFADNVWVEFAEGTRTRRDGQAYSYDDIENGINGDGEFDFELDRWYCIEIHSKMNSDADRPDGLVEMWIDGRLVFGKYHIKHYDAANAHNGTNIFELQHIYGTRSSSDQPTYMDNIVIADSYIGPVKAPPQPSACAMAWSDPSYHAAEGAATVAVTIVRSGDSVGPAMVDWRTLDGSAVQGEDFEGVSRTTAAFADGETSKTATLHFVDDTEVEEDETLTISLFNPANCTLGSQADAVVTLVNDDADQSAPQANFTADPSPARGPAPLTVRFTDTSKGIPTSWQWDFDGDGRVDATGQNPQHTYTEADNYIVSVTAANEAGTDTMTMPVIVTAGELRPDGAAEPESKGGNGGCFVGATWIDGTGLGH